MRRCTLRNCAIAETCKLILTDFYQPNTNFNPYIHYNAEQFALSNGGPAYNVPALNVASGTQFNAQQPSRFEAPNLQRVPTTLNYSIRHTSENEGEFESKLIGSPNNAIPEQMNSAAMLDKQYLLLGNDNGLWVMDFSTHWDLIKPLQLIRGCSFKKLHVLEEYNMMIAIAGKKDMIRIYRLDSLLHLIKFVSNSESKSPIDLSKAPRKIAAPKCESCGRILEDNRTSPNCPHCGFAPSVNSKLVSNLAEPLRPSPSKLNRKLSTFTSNLSIYVRNYLSNSPGINASMWRWATDYISLPESVKDCTTFDITEIKNIIYLTAVTLNNGIILFSMPTEMKGSPDCKFDYLKSYYVPGSLNFVNVVVDSSSIKQIIAITGIGSSKAAIIDCYTTDVTEINMKKNITPKDVEFPSWTNFIQIPYSYSLDFLNNNPIVTDDRPIIPLSPPYNQSHLSPSFLTYSHNTPPEKGNDNISRRFTYQVNRITNETLDQDTARRRSSEFPSVTNSDVPLSPPMSPVKATFETLLPGQVFVCTISNTSYLVNIHAEPYKHHRSIHWSSDPIHITLLPTFDDILLIAFEKQTIEIASLKTGKVIKKVTGGSQVKFLGESLKKPPQPKGNLPQYKTDENHLNNFIRKHVFWSSKMNTDVYVYRGLIA
ncbi:11042_t:CDS:2 [Racocetra fulgida]|uniref:11042_t:CDS:1 n=1 Tax=Racocetra fulgida TaxID=60492 RepID=A0A9N8VHZ2_9GLOM|nr:11042_t:CDS:2 [Racocetra fulgida]